MGREMKVKCCGCSTVYDLSEDMAGQVAECPVCESLFEIPAPSGNPEEILQAVPSLGQNPLQENKEPVAEGAQPPEEAHSDHNLDTADEIKIQCFKCDSVYDLPLEMAGQIAECPVCESIFEIPPPGKGGQVLNSAPYVAEPEASEKPVPSTDSSKDKTTTSVDLEPAAPTNTVRLSRASVGMRPDVQDQFGVDEVKETARTKVTVPEGGVDGGTGISLNSTKRDIALTKTPPVSRRKKSFWQKLFFWRK